MYCSHFRTLYNQSGCNNSSKKRAEIEKLNILMVTTFKQMLHTSTLLIDHHWTLVIISLFSSSYSLSFRWMLNGSLALLLIESVSVVNRMYNEEYYLIDWFYIKRNSVNVSKTNTCKIYSLNE
jgi:hypothetical protein